MRSKKASSLETIAVIQVRRKGGLDSRNSRRGGCKMPLPVLFPLLQPCLAAVFGIIPTAIILIYSVALLKGRFERLEKKFSRL